MLELNFQSNPNASALKAISLFAGAGGCSLGFSKYGYHIVRAFDIWQEAVETYNSNFQGHIAEKADLSTCDFDTIRNSLNLKRGDLDVIIGGPPCQGFTSAGARSAADPRNKLLANYAAALDSFYPHWFMMENVEGMLTTGKGDYVVDCILRMIELGYTVCLKKVYMHEYGIPQRRKRVIIVGNRDGKTFSFPKVDTMATGFRYKNGAHTLREAISDLEGHDIAAINHVRHQPEGIQLQRILTLKEGETMRDLPKELQHESFLRRSSRRVCDGTPSEKRGGAPSGLKRLVYDEPCLTITGSATSEFVHPRENRMLTVRECARIQTFPDDFLFTGTEAQQEQQIGNAIPPLFANKIARQIFLCSQRPTRHLPPGLLYYDVTKSSQMSPLLASTCGRLDDFLISNMFSYEQATKSVL